MNVLTMMRRRPTAEPAELAPPRSAVPDAMAVVAVLAQQASALGKEAAEVRGVLDDTAKTAGAQGVAVQALARQVQEVVTAQAGIAEETGRGLQAMNDVAEAVQAVSTEVGGIVETLHQVSEAAGQITQIALQTRLVAFNASVEAKRAGEAGRGFGVVADAVKDLAGKVESSSKEITGTVARLDSRVAALAREISRDGGGKAAPGQREARQGAVHRALSVVEGGVKRIHEASENSRQVCGGLTGQIAAIEGEMRRTTAALGSAFVRSETFLRISENLIESVAECGIETEDTPYIRAVQQAAARMSELLDEAVRSGAITAADLFDEQYRPVEGSNPAQHLTRFVGPADRLFPQIQEELFKLTDKVAFCVAVDRNGYLPCHNRIYNHTQRPGDPTWNAANCRNRRIFNDRTGLASARNQRPFLLQTYRRDMGGGNFVLMKEAAAPITVGGRHWGGLRLGFKF
jgi:methyl-accepting chemotaxis protein